MNNPNLDKLEKDMENKHIRRTNKKNKNMKISGGNVRKLAKIIHDKKNI